MNVEQAVAIDVCSVLFINNLLIYSYSRLIVLHNRVSANQQPYSFTCNSKESRPNICGEEKKLVHLKLVLYHYYNFWILHYVNFGSSLGGKYGSCSPKFLLKFWTIIHTKFRSRFTDLTLFPEISPLFVNQTMAFILSERRKKTCGNGVVNLEYSFNLFDLIFMQVFRLRLPYNWEVERRTFENYLLNKVDLSVCLFVRFFF